MVALSDCAQVPVCAGRLWSMLLCCFVCGQWGGDSARRAAVTGLREEQAPSFGGPAIATHTSACLGQRSSPLNAAGQRGPPFFSSPDESRARPEARVRTVQRRGFLVSRRRLRRKAGEHEGSHGEREATRAGGLCARERGGGGGAEQRRRHSSWPPRVDAQSTCFVFACSLKR